MLFNMPFRNDWRKTLLFLLALSAAYFFGSEDGRQELTPKQVDNSRALHTENHASFFYPEADQKSSLLATLQVSQEKIVISEALTLGMLPHDKDTWLKIAADMRIKILHALPNCYLPPQLIQHLLQDASFSIEIVNGNHPSLRGNDGIDAMYLPRSNRIIVVLDSDITEQRLQQVLTNELHHAIVRQANVQHHGLSVPTSTQADFLHGLHPFHEHKPTLNYKDHQQAIGAFKKEVAKFRKLFSKASLSKKQKALLGKYYQALKSYSPIIHRASQPAATIHLLPLELRVGGIITLHQQRYKVLQLDRYGDTITFQYQHVANSHRERAKAFLDDFDFWFSENNQAAPYQQQSSFMQAAEISSNIQEFAQPGIAMLFLQAWCEYFTRFTQAVSGYCPQQADTTTTTTSLQA